jgi:hypothetical protein
LIRKITYSLHFIYRESHSLPRQNKNYRNFVKVRNSITDEYHLQFSWRIKGIIKNVFHESMIITVGFEVESTGKAKQSSKAGSKIG